MGIAKLTDAKTWAGNRRAIASHHAARWTQVSCRQVRKETDPGLTTSPRFRHRPYAFDTSSAVRFRSSLQAVPDGILSRLFRNAHHHGF